VHANVSTDVPDLLRADGVDVVVVAVRFGLPPPGVEPGEVGVIHQGEAVLADGILAA
jgi:hypothetical protein